MKIKKKILLLAIGPVLLLGIVSMALTLTMMRGSMLDEIQEALKSGSGRAERDDSLAGKVVVLYEVVDRPSCDAPPDRIADQNGIIRIPVCGSNLCQCNIPKALIIMLSGYPAGAVSPVQVITGIGLYRSDSCNVPPILWWSGRSPLWEYLTPE